MLTEKEIEVLKLRKRGLKQSEIAKRLSISQPAVSSFESGINRKLRDSIETLKLIKELGLDIEEYKKRGKP